MSPLLQRERYSHESSSRRAGPGDAGGCLGRQWRGGFARQSLWTRDGVSQRLAGGVNTSISRRLGEGTWWAMLVWSWVEWAGADKRPSLGDCHRLPPVCQRPATVCHQLPFPATHCQFSTKIPRTWRLDRRPGTDLNLWRISRPPFELWGQVSEHWSAADGPRDREKQASHLQGPVTGCHIAGSVGQPGKKSIQLGGERIGRGDLRSSRRRGRRPVPSTLTSTRLWAFAEEKTGRIAKCKSSNAKVKMAGRRGTIPRTIVEVTSKPSSHAWWSPWGLEIEVELAVD